jgi:hypothetical protein
MKHKLFSIIVMVLAGSFAMAQAPQDSVVVKDSTTQAATVEEDPEVISPATSSVCEEVSTSPT